MRFFTHLLKLCLALVLFTGLMESAQAVSHDDFITTWRTDTANDEITFPGEGIYTINWGDGTTESATGSATHRYAAAGDYDITVSNITRFNLSNLNNDDPDKGKLREVKQWGTASWTSMENAFLGATKMQISAADMPDLSGVNSMQGMFRNANAFNSDIGGWNVSTVTNMGRLFQATAFNQDISLWNVSAVTDMSSMFRNAKAFNQDISGWDVSKVTGMDSMFFDATAFNQDISGWDVSAVTNMSRMFNGATVFRQNLGLWYIVQTPTANYNGNTNLQVLSLSAQNAILDRHNPVYTLVAGDGDGNNNIFTLTKSGALSIKAAQASGGNYRIRIAADSVEFGTDNARAITVTVPASVQTPVPSICDRTTEVRDAILNISGVSACADVTVAHLATITELFLGDGSVFNGVKSGDFNGMTSLTELVLYSNGITKLPAGIFNGLGSLTTLRLDNNPQLTELPAGIFNGLNLINLGLDRLAPTDLTATAELGQIALRWIAPPTGTGMLTVKNFHITGSPRRRGKGVHAKTPSHNE